MAEENIAVTQHICLSHHFSDWNHFTTKEMPNTTSDCKPVVFNWKLKLFKPCLDTLFIPTIKKKTKSLPLGSSEHIQLGIQKHWKSTGLTAKFHES